MSVKIHSAGLHEYRNAIMLCVNFTSVNFASADGIAKKKIAIIELVGVALDRCG